MIAIIASTLEPISVDAPADPAVSVYLSVVFCNGVKFAPVATCCILVFRNATVPNVADLIDAGICGLAMVLSASSPSK